MDPYRKPGRIQVKFYDVRYGQKDGKDFASRAKEYLENALNDGWTLIGQSEGGGGVLFTLCKGPQ